MTKQELIKNVEIIIEAHRNNKYVSTTALMVMIIKVMEHKLSKIQKGKHVRFYDSNRNTFSFIGPGYGLPGNIRL